jgi:AcrR family transcriptional regulator
MRKLANKQIILSAAISSIASDGLSVSLRKVAKVAEVSPGLVIHHFGSREALIDSAVRSCLHNLLDRKDSFSGEDWNGALVEMFLEISQAELNVLRQVLVSDNHVAQQLFSIALEYSTSLLHQAHPHIDDKELVARAAVLAAQALGSVVMLPQLLKYISAPELALHNQRVSGL